MTRPWPLSLTLFMGAVALLATGCGGAEPTFTPGTPVDTPEGATPTLYATPPGWSGQTPTEGVPTPSASPGTTSPTPVTHIPGDGDGDGVAAPEDCDDADAAVYPGAPERCDAAAEEAIDDDCDGLSDEGLPLFNHYPDGDGDGYGDLAGEPVYACGPPTGYVLGATDCDDAQASVHPGAEEVCDGVDSNCNGSTEDEVGEPAWPDGDGDGFGDSAGVQITTCVQTEGYARVADDCDDNDGAVHPALVDASSQSPSPDGSAAAPYVEVAQAMLATPGCGLVLVRPGFYSASVAVSGVSGVTVRSTEGAAATILAPDGFVRAINLSGVSDVAFEGFTVSPQDPVSGSGAAIRVVDSARVRFEGLVVRDATAAGTGTYGGGLYLEGSSQVVLRGVEVLRNVAANGGGLAVLESSVEVEGCTFEGNDASIHGGAVLVDRISEQGVSSTVRVSASAFVGNEAGSYGGAVAAFPFQVTELIDSTFTGNRTLGVLAGAAHNPTRVERCIFVGNKAAGGSSSHGGALVLRESSEVLNSIFVANEAALGGAIYVDAYTGALGAHTLSHNTFADNVARGALGGAVYVIDGDQLNLRSCILADFGTGVDTLVHNIDSGLVATVDHSDLYTGTAAFGGVGLSASVLTTNGNLTLTPQFVDYSAGQASFDLHLLPGSPCVDAGSQVGGLDADGSAPDMGAYGGAAGDW